MRAPHDHAQRDMVFGDGTEHLVAAVTGNTTSGYSASPPIDLASC